MSMRIAKRPTLFFRFFGVGFAHTFHKFYNLPSNTLISFNFFCHSTLRPPFTPIQYARGAFVTYGDSGVALLPGGNTGSGLRLLPYGQYAYAAALCRIRSIRAACAAMCSLRCAHTPRLSATPIPIQAASLRSNRGAIPNLFSSPRACAGESIMRCEAHGESIQTMQNLRIQCESSTFLSIKIRRPNRVGHKNSP